MKPSPKAKHIRKPLNLSKGGAVVRHYDSGGTVLSGPTAGPNTPNTSTGGIAGGVSNLVGTNNNFQAGYAPIQAGTTAGQLNNVYGQAQTGVGVQQGLTNTFSPQALQAVNTQNQLTGQLQGVIAGTGPNPAQAALAQNTATNVANTAALQAGQRGGAANAGLLARQVGQQGAATQQQAVGQAATQQAQQQIAAQQQLQQLAAQQAAQAQGGATNLNNVVQNEQNILQGANTNLNNVNVAQQGGVNNVNSQVASGNQSQSNNILNDVGSGVSSALSFIGLAKGGEVPNMAAGGELSVAAPTAVSFSSEAPINSQVQVSSPQIAAPAPAAAQAAPSEEKSSPISELPAAAALFAYKGGKIAEGPHKSHVANFLMNHDVPAMVSPGEAYLSPDQVRDVMENGTDPKKVGQHIPGKAKVKGDSLKNDDVPVTLQEGGVVIPRHLMRPKVSAKERELFVHQSIARKHLRNPE